MLRPLIKDKRGDIFQLPYLIVLVLVLGLLGLFIGYISWNVTEAYKDIDAINNTSYAKQANENFGNAVPSIVDTFVLLFFLGATIGLMVAAVRTNFSVVIMGLFLILLILAIFIASGAANIYQGFAQDSSLSVFSDRLTFTNILFSRYTPLIITLIGAALLIIMYGKSGSNISI